MAESTEFMAKADCTVYGRRYRAGDVVAVPAKVGADLAGRGVLAARAAASPAQKQSSAPADKQVKAPRDK